MNVFERTLASQHLGVWVVSAEDAEIFRGWGVRYIQVVPNGCDLPVWPVRERPGEYLVFVGSLQSPFNREGIDWFLRECWSLVRERVPSATLVLAGEGSEDFRGAGVVALGRVASVEEPLRGARAAIVPILSGGGSRLKVPEALAWGLPTVATSVGAAGHRIDASDGLLLADTPHKFVEECVQLLTDAGRARELGHAGRRVAERRLTWLSAAHAALRSLPPRGESW
jgi:glycosyltransferase involved in cell wall biosynthesis